MTLSGPCLALNGCVLGDTLSPGAALLLLSVDACPKRQWVCARAPKHLDDLTSISGDSSVTGGQNQRWCCVTVAKPMGYLAATFPQPSADGRPEASVRLHNSFKAWPLLFTTNQLMGDLKWQQGNCFKILGLTHHHLWVIGSQKKQDRPIAPKPLGCPATSQHGESKRQAWPAGSMQDSWRCEAQHSCINCTGLTPSQAS